MATAHPRNVHATVVFAWAFGPVTALSVRVAIDDPRRFVKSKTVPVAQLGARFHPNNRPLAGAPHISSDIAVKRSPFARCFAQIRDEVRALKPLNSIPPFTTLRDLTRSALWPSMKPSRGEASDDRPRSSDRLAQSAEADRPTRPA
jgi:hypothetical protein